MSASPLHAALYIAAVWLAIVAPHSVRWVARVLFPLGALFGLGLASIALVAIAQPPHTTVLPLGLPDLPFHFRIDALSAFFLALLGTVAAGVSIFAAGYIRPGAGTPPGLQCLWYHVFLASMALVLLADDAYAFMVTWETMAVSSFFLVTSDHRLPEIRRAGLRLHRRRLRRELCELRAGRERDPGRRGSAGLPADADRAPTGHPCRDHGARSRLTGYGAPAWNSCRCSS